MGKDDKKTRPVPRKIPNGHVHGGLAGKKDYVQAESGSSRYKAQDPYTCMRVIRDGPDGQEFIITGSREDTFAQACKGNWYFESVKRKSNWHVTDERGNDVSDKLMDSVDGIFTLVPEDR